MMKSCSYACKKRREIIAPERITRPFHGRSDMGRYDLYALVPVSGVTGSLPVLFNLDDPA
jgi:hypothetical protein